MNKWVIVIFMSAALGFVDVIEAQEVYELIASPENVHWGHFSADVEPAVRVNPGDIVVIEDVPRLDPVDMEKRGIPAEEMSESYRRVYSEVTDRGPGPHIMVGPVYVNGAEPGDVLEVRVLSVDVAYTFGYSRLSSRGGTLPGEFQRWERILRMDLDKQVTEAAEGVVIPLDPFFGSMGVAPEPEAGRISTVPPGAYGGNMDNKDLGAGSILYIPVNVEGALFSTGDAHFAQGDGESCITAIEMGATTIVRFQIRKGEAARLDIRWPRFFHSDYFAPPQWAVPRNWTATMGMPIRSDGTQEAGDLNLATRNALLNMIDLLGERGWSRQQAYVICSVAVDLRLSNIVNRPNFTVSAFLPEDIFHGADGNSP